VEPKPCSLSLLASDENSSELRLGNVYQERFDILPELLRFEEPQR
jgi:hypothetical protein